MEPAESRQAPAIQSVAAPAGGTRRHTFASDTGFRREVQRRVAEHFERTAVSPRGSGRMYLKSFLLLSWCVSSYLLLILVATSWWHVAILSLSLALGMAGVAFAVQHDANHAAYSDTPWLGRLAGFTLDLMGGSSYVWKWKHNIAHHTYTHLPEADSDIDIPFARLAEGQPRHGYHRHQHVYIWLLYALFVAHWQLYQDFKQLAVARVASRRIPRPQGWDLWSMIAGKVCFFGWAFLIPMLLYPWWVALSTYLVTSVLLSLVLVFVFQLAHSVEEAALPQPELGAAGAYVVPRSWAKHQVEATADFARSNRLITWYVGGLNFQIEHHLFPRVCHIHYPAISGIVEATCREYGVRYSVHPSLWTAIRSHGRWLHRMGHAADGLVPNP